MLHKELDYILKPQIRSFHTSNITYSLCGEYKATTTNVSFFHLLLDDNFRNLATMKLLAEDNSYAA